MSIGSINGLMCYKARYYSTDLGRFLQVDPIGYEDQMNMYAYVYNDPLNNTDPTGKCGPLTAHCIAPDTYFDLGSAGVGASSALNNLSNGNFIAAGVDTLGAIVDVAAAAVPGVPGGASLGIQATRAGANALDAARATDTAGDSVDVFRAVDKTEFDNISQTGKFELGPNGAEVKAFVDNSADANALAKVYSDSNGEAYTVVRGSAPSGVVNSAERYNFTDVPGKPMEAIALRGQNQLDKVCNIEVCN